MSFNMWQKLIAARTLKAVFCGASLSVTAVISLTLPLMISY